MSRRKMLLQRFLRAIVSIVALVWLLSSIDRDAVWAVQQLVFSAEAIKGLPDEFDSLQEVYLAVEANGFEWDLSQTPSGP